MRIPITIKIPVSVDGQASALGDIAHVVIRDISNELEKITVRVLNRKPPHDTLQRREHKAKQELRNVSPNRFPVVFQPKSDAPPQPILVMPRVRYSVKTIHITLTWPTLPSLERLWHKLTAIPRKAWLWIGVAIIVLAIFVLGLQLFGNHHAGKPLVATSHSVVLQKGTPNYATILPAGKTIDDLGGWRRVSPPDAAPVYTYVDKIGAVQIDVSEQPLPPNFQHDTASQIAQLAKDYSANDSFAAGGTTVYVGTSAPGPQSAIFTKNNLLVLIKSTAPVADSSWSAYANSLQ